MANTATRISANGTLFLSGNLDEVTFNPNSGVKKNLIYNSKTLTDTSVFGTTAAALTSTSILAPDGTNTAYVLTETATGPSGHNFVSSGLPNGTIKSVSLFSPFTVSVYAKAKERTAFQIVMQCWNTFDKYYAYNFDLTAGTTSFAFSTTGSTISGASITPVGNGWYRCSLNGVILNSLNPTVTFICHMISAGVTSYTGDGTSGMYFWGPQFESGTSPTIYEPTSSNAIPSPNAASKTDITGSVYVKNYFDEITYNPNSNVTPVNILSYTQDLDNAYWGKYQGSITPNVTVAPDGTLTADKWVENTVSGVEHFYYKGLAFVNTTLTGSVYLKAAERNRAVVGFSNFVNATAGVSFDLIAGTIIYTVPNNFDFINISGTITNVGNGWFRCTVTATKIGFTNTAANFQVTLITTGTTTVYTGDGTSGLYAWGHQVEFGSVATDYIPMNAAGVMATPRFVQRLTANGTNYVKANYDEFTGILPVTKGLILNLDPAVYDSYPGSGNTWTNLANNAISATFVNNTPSYSTDNGGVIRMTGRFEGNTYANTALPSNTFTPTSEKTFSIWVKFNSKMKSLTEYNAKITGYVYGTLATATQNTYGSTGILVGCSYFGDYGLNWILYRTSGSYYISVQSHNRVNLPTYQESTLGYDIGYSSTFDSAFDRWYNITSTYSSSLNSHVLYVNGNSVTSTTTITNGSPYPYSRPTITIGKNDIYGGNGFDCTFNGDIGQTLIYNRALTSAEVLQNYNIFKNRYGL